MILELYLLLRTIGVLYIWIIIIASFLSFVHPDPYNPIVQAIRRLTEPVFAFIRKKLPFVVISGMDLSPLVIIFGLQAIDIVVLSLLRG